MTKIAESAEPLACVFFGITPLAFFTIVAEITDTYDYTDWVVKVESNDRDGNTKKKMHYKDCPKSTHGIPTLEMRHRADDKPKKYSITPGFILC